MVWCAILKQNKTLHLVLYIYTLPLASTKIFGERGKYIFHPLIIFPFNHRQPDSPIPAASVAAVGALANRAEQSKACPLMPHVPFQGMTSPVHKDQPRNVGL